MADPERQAEILRARLDPLRVAREGAHLLRERLHERARVWTAGSGRLRERPAPEQLTIWERPRG
jgi:hypothetical protein